MHESIGSICQHYSPYTFDVKTLGLHALMRIKSR